MYNPENFPATSFVMSFLVKRLPHNLLEKTKAVSTKIAKSRRLPLSSRDPYYWSKYENLNAEILGVLDEVCEE